MTSRFDPDLLPERPQLDFERSLWSAGCSAVAGIDEAGRGCLAGPVTAAAVILPNTDRISADLRDVRDSKQLSPVARERLRGRIESCVKSWGVGWASCQEIDRLGILPATRLAASRALKELAVQPDHLLIDYLVLADIDTPQTRLIKGDMRSLSIAAASILAKTHRDSWMIGRSQKYPDYNFHDNKGYGTAAHRKALRDHGPCPLHRMSFAPLRNSN